MHCHGAIAELLMMSIEVAMDHESIQNTISFRGPFLLGSWYERAYIEDEP